MASVIRNARTVSATSWVRNIRAPARAASTVQASAAGSRLRFRAAGNFAEERLP